jgi:hypothetical protein
MGSLNVLNPFDVLDVSRYDSPVDVKAAFREKIYSSSRYQRARAALAYDMICSKDSTRYMKLGNMYYVEKTDHFYYVTTGNYQSFVEQIRRQKSLLNQRDEHGRTLLYIASKNGFHDICNFLLKSGCNINETQHCGSTALHAVAYYGHKLIVQLLLEYEANPRIKNKFGNEPEAEGCSLEIQQCIRSKTNDQINTLLNVLKTQGLVKNMVVIKHDDKIIAKKILRNSEYFPEYSISYLTKYWTLAWHGTKYNHLQSIMRYGLHSAGTVLWVLFK